MRTLCFGIAVCGLVVSLGSVKAEEQRTIAKRHLTGKGYGCVDTTCTDANVCQASPTTGKFLVIQYTPVPVCGQTWNPFQFGCTSVNPNATCSKSWFNQANCSPTGPPDSTGTLNQCLR